MHWDQQQSSLPNESEGRTTLPRIVVQATVNSARQEFQFITEGRGEDELARFVGYLFLAVMPKKGLSEILVLLKDALEFYRKEELYWLPPPVVMGTGVAIATRAREDPNIMVLDL